MSGFILFVPFFNNVFNVKTSMSIGPRHRGDKLSRNLSTCMTHRVIPTRDKISWLERRAPSPLIILPRANFVAANQISVNTSPEFANTMLPAVIWKRLIYVPLTKKCRPISKRKQPRMESYEWMLNANWSRCNFSGVGVAIQSYQCSMQIAIKMLYMWHMTVWSNKM
jgi:hypothetical protein